MVDLIDIIRDRGRSAQNTGEVLELNRAECNAICRDLLSKAEKANTKSINGVSTGKLQAALDGNIPFTGFDFGIGLAFKFVGVINGTT
jgi:hypothetical protein